MRTTPLPWQHDPCPPEPLVLLGDLALPPGVPTGLQRVLADVHTTAAEVTASQRALALAWCTSASRGVLVRDTAVWVWSGEPSMTPSRVDLANGPPAPRLPGPRPGGGRRGLPLRPVRWEADQTWTTVAGVALTDPAATAVAAARLLPEDQARRRLAALDRCPGYDALEALRLLPRVRGRPGHAQAERLLREGAQQAGGSAVAAPSR